MPVYEYQCENCSYRFELKKSFNDNSAVTCLRCRSNARRIFSPVSIIFKGPGFYVTDKATEDKNRFGNRRDGDRPAGKEKKTELAKENKEESVS